MRQILTLLCCVASVTLFSQDSLFLKVHFLYGSRPVKQFRAIEKKWFGGILGGHAGIESDSNKIVNFLPDGKFHWFTKKRDPHSKYALHSPESFYSIFGGNRDSMKRLVVYVPVTVAQKHKFDSIASVYLRKTPYDYAFIGMRCGAATYEMLAQLDILRAYSHTKTHRKIFYPRKLRKLLIQKAIDYGWTMVRYEGSFKRRWEKD
ncbi:MAG: hypothetical protein V4722_17385 [Bacteroidota bacterium]